MAAKRSGADVDPDYEDVAEHQAKRQRFIEEDAKEASVKKIEGILDHQLRMALDDKEQEVKEIDQRLHHSRAMMDRLRAVIVASYYSRLQQAPGKMMTSSEAPPPSIHPTAKKHIGKAPVGTEKEIETNDFQSLQSSLSSVSSTDVGQKDNTAAPSSTRQQGVPKTSTTSATATTAVATTLPLRKKDENEGSRFTVKKTIIVGNVSRFILPDQREPNDQSTHKWMVYVRGPSDDQRIDSFVSKVWFFLHPSYRPNDLVEVCNPPFHLTRRGWGVFPVRVQLHFWDARNKRVDIIHNLKLDETYTGLQTLGAETVVEIELQKDQSPVTPRSQLSSNLSSSDNVLIEASVKQEPHDSDTTSSPTSGKCQCPCQLSDSKDCLGHRKDCVDCPRREKQSTCQVGSQNEEARDCDAVRLDGKKVTIKEEPPDDYEMKEHVADTSGRFSSHSTGEGNKRDTPECSGSDLDCDRSTQDKRCDNNTHGMNKDSILKTSRIPESAGDFVQTSDKNGLQQARSFTQESVTLNSKSECSSCSDVFVDTACPSITATSSAVPRTTTVSASSPSLPNTSISLLQPHLIKSSSQPTTGSKSFSLLSGSQIQVQGHQGSSTRPANASPQPVQVLLVGGSKAGTKSLLAGGTSLLASSAPAAKTTVLSEGIPGVGGAPSPVLKVTSQGLRPVSSNTASGGASVLGKLTPANTQAVSLLEPRTVASVLGTRTATQGQAVSLLEPRTVASVLGTRTATQGQAVSLLEPKGKPFSLLGPKVSKLGKKGSLLNPRTPAAGQKTPMPGESIFPRDAVAKTSVVSVPSHVELSQGLAVESTGGSSSSSFPQLAGKGLCSLLNTAPRPAVQALLQKRLLSASNVSSTSTPSESSSAVVSTVVSTSSASFFSSSTSALPSSSSSSSSSSPGPLTLSPGDSYVVANLNNKKVLMRVNAATLKMIQGTSSAGQISSRTTSPGSNLSSSSPSLGSQSTKSGVPTSQIVLPKNGSIGPKPAGSGDARLLQWAAMSKREGQGHTQGQSSSQGEGPKSRAGIELAKIKAAMQESGRLSVTTKAAVQMARLKASLQEKIQTEPPPPKSRCARWFRYGLGSSLVSVGTEEDSGELNDLEKDVTESGSVEEMKVIERPGEKAEKRIMVLKKQKMSEVEDIVACPVASLTRVDEFSDLTSVLRVAVSRHPLIALSTDKCTHPYSATSVNQWLEWHPAKRNASEWSRAFAVRKYLQRHLGTEGVFKGEQLWSTKQIMQWCRVHGLSPNGPCGRPVCNIGSADSTTAQLVNRRFMSLSGADVLLSSFPPVDKKDDDNNEDSNDSLDVEVVGEDLPRTTLKIKKEEPAAIDCDLDFLPRSDEAMFVQDTAAQIGVQFFPAVIAPGVVSSTAEDMVFAAMLEFASDILHQACSFSLLNSTGPTLTSCEVFQALKTLPTANFFTNQHCGVLDPASPTKR